MIISDYAQKIGITFPLAPETETRKTWEYLPHILGLALLFRLICAFSTNSVVHPDEMFQYLEQAHRLVFGYGIVPWEYVYGIRSWLIPGFIALILLPTKLLGLDSPDIYIPLVKAVFCVISLSLPFALYRLGQVAFNENTARVVLIVSSFWYEFVFYAHKPSPDIIAVYPLLGAIFLLYRPCTSNRLIAIGALTALTIALRFQFVPMAAMILLIAALQWRFKAWPAVAVFSFAILATGLIDYWTWGYFYSSFFVNYELNAAHGVAASFGHSPLDYYARVLTYLTVGIILPGSIGLLTGWRTTWPLLAVAAIGAAAFHAVAHKEARFMLWYSPFFILGFSYVIALVLRADIFPIKSKPSAGQAIAAGLALWVVAGAALGFAWVLPYKKEGYRFALLEQRDLILAYQYLSRRDDVEALVDNTRIEGVGTYYTLHHDVPLYHLRFMRSVGQQILREPARYASHWLSTSSDRPPQGFEMLEQIGEVMIWKRDDGPDTPSTVDTSLVADARARWALPPGPIRKNNVAPKVTPFLPQ